MPAPWLSGAYVVPELAARKAGFPFTLPFAVVSAAMFARA